MTIPPQNPPSAPEKRKFHMPGSIVFTLRVKLGMRALMGGQAALEKTSIPKLLRRAFRYYMQAKISRGQAFFQSDSYNLELQDRDIAAELEQSLREYDPLHQGLSLEALKEKTSQALHIKESLKIMPEGMRKTHRRFRLRILNEIGGHALVLKETGYDFRTLSYLLRAQHRGDFPYLPEHPDYEEFVRHDTNCTAEELGLPDQQYMAEDAVHGVVYPPEARQVWAARPNPRRPSITEEEYREIFAYTPPPDMEDGAYDPEGIFRREKMPR